MLNQEDVPVIALQQTEIEARLAALNSVCSVPWCIEQGRLRKSFKFPSFSRAFAFMTQLALYAEKANHHPDWRNCFRAVDVELYTFDVQGLSQLDFDFAHAAEAACGAQ